MEPVFTAAADRSCPAYNFSSYRLTAFDSVKENDIARSKREAKKMPTLIVVNREGASSTVEGEIGRSLMEIIRDAGFGELEAICGGSCFCSTCHIRVDPTFLDRLAEIGTAEDELLDGSSHRVATSRLACQIPMKSELDGLRVTIAPAD
jgi:ferredoxin, 2Fe-2S